MKFISIRTVRKNLFTMFLVSGMLLASVNAKAENDTDFRRFEFEVGAGMTMGARNGFDKANPGIKMFLEARTNLKDSPLDLGFQISVTNHEKKSGDSRYSFRELFGLTTFADWNFRCWKNIAPFAGIGVGMSMVEQSSNNEGTVIFGGGGAGASVAPRIGAEFFNHIRLTAEYKVFYKGNGDITGKCSNHFALTLGYAFGGGKRK